MRKQMGKVWLPACSFVIAGIMALFAGPSLGFLGRLRMMQSTTDCDTCCHEIHQGMDDGTSTGSSPSTCKSSGNPVRYFNGQNMMDVPELLAPGLSGWSHGRAVVSNDTYSGGVLGSLWRITGLLQLKSVSSTVFVVAGPTSVRTF